MKCVSDAATSTILRLSDRDAAFLVSEKPHRYSYASKSAFKAEKAYLAENAKRTTPLKRVFKSRKGRRSHGEVR